MNVAVDHERLCSFMEDRLEASPLNSSMNLSLQRLLGKIVRLSIVSVSQHHPFDEEAKLEL